MVLFICETDATSMFSFYNACQKFAVAITEISFSNRKENILPINP